MARKPLKLMKPRSHLSNKDLTSHGNFVERAKRLKNIVEGLNVTKAFPLLYEVKLDQNIFNMLEAGVKQYLFASLNVNRKHKLFDMNVDVLKKFTDECVSLPNRTPNGMLMPKKENSFEFNMIGRAIATMLSEMNLEDRVESVLAPMMLRLITGKVDREANKRPYASTKVHTDIWAGGPARVLSCFIPVLGDIKHTTMKLFEPNEKVMANNTSMLSDYDLGADVMSTAVEYDIELKHGNVYFFDSYLLHQTIKKGGYPRLSVDLRIVPKQIVKGDIIDHSDTHQNWKLQFIELRDWYEIVNSKVIVSHHTFEEASKNFSKKGPRGKKAPKPVAMTVDYTKYFKYVDLFR